VTEEGRNARLRSKFDAIRTAWAIERRYATRIRAEVVDSDRAQIRIDVFDANALRRARLAVKDALQPVIGRKSGAS